MNNIVDKKQISIIQKSFETQASTFNSKKYHLSKQEYLNYMIEKTAPQKTDNIVEVASGTCICGCAFTPYVAHVTCLDATSAMLEIGKTECEKKNIRNITFVKGIAEELPFLDNSFDIVISRLAFHHFVSVKEIFLEMKRVLKQGGKLVLIDMVSKDFADTANGIEKLRDYSHVRNLTLSEMKDLYIKNNMTFEVQEETEISVSLESWMNLTNTNEENRQKIRQMMIDDIEGKTITGFFPYKKQNNIYFNQHWVFNMGKKITL